MRPDPTRVVVRFLQSADPSYRRPSTRDRKFTVLVQESADDPRPAEAVIEGQSYHDGRGLWVLGKVKRTSDPAYRWAIGSWVLAVDGIVTVGGEDKTPETHLDFIEVRRGDAAAMALTPMNRAAAQGWPSALYHVTFLHQVPSIASSGLQPGSGTTFGGYGGHAQGRLFFTDWGGVSFWMTKYEAIAENKTDNPEKGWIPVVLRVKTKHLDLRDDELGSSDARSGAYYIEQGIPSNRMAMWNGQSWAGLRSIDVEDMVEEAKDAAVFESDEDDEYGDGEGWYIMDYEVFKPSKKAFDLG